MKFWDNGKGSRWYIDAALEETQACGGGGPGDQNIRKQSHRDAERVLSVLGAQGESISSTGSEMGKGCWRTL